MTMLFLFFLAEEIVNPVYCPNGDRDEVWGIVWNEVLVGGRDIQACRSLDGSPTDGESLSSHSHMYIHCKPMLHSKGCTLHCSILV